MIRHIMGAWIDTRVCAGWCNNATGGYLCERTNFDTNVCINECRPSSLCASVWSNECVCGWINGCVHNLITSVNLHDSEPERLFT